MNKHYLCLVVLVLVLNSSDALAHGRSEQMTQELNAKAPEWLSIGVPIKVQPLISPPKEQPAFRSRSGGATNSRNRVQIPSRGIKIILDYNIDWTGNNEAGLGCSLSPDGTKLITNSGTISHLYEIQANGTYREIPLQLPHVTYDDGPKGYLREWAWADDQILVARAEITEETGDYILENRIYVYHMEQGVLSRLDLSALSLADTDGIEVAGIGSDLSQLKLSVGNTFVIAKADLKSPPKLIEQELQIAPPEAGRSETDRSPRNPAQGAKDAASVAPPESSTPWGLIVVMIMAALGLLWWLFKGRK